jgi:hypothetical protein
VVWSVYASEQPGPLPACSPVVLIIAQHNHIHTQAAEALCQPLQRVSHTTRKSLAGILGTETFPAAGTCNESLSVVPMRCETCSVPLSRLLGRCSTA